MDVKSAARTLWERHLQRIGVKLINEAVRDIMDGTVKRIPQDNRFSTFEPAIDVKDIYRPDALMLDWHKNGVLEGAL